MAAGEESIPAATLAAGTVVGDYRVLQVLGRGGMGIVYVAEHVRLGKQVALKVLREELAEDAVAIQRFFEEARAAHNVGHENIIEVIDFIATADDQRAYAMELLEGRSLKDEIEAGVPLPWERVFRICRQVADALNAVHEKGIVHRDLKPENIVLLQRTSRPDFVKLLDFGVAKLLTAKSLRTATGITMGTPAYMSPEQVLGEDIDGRADIYALGIILFELATGQRPFKAKSLPALMEKHVSEHPPSPSALAPRPLPAGFEDLILRCIAKRPSARPKTMADVAARLAALEEHEREQAPPSKSAPSKASPPRTLVSPLVPLQQALPTAENPITDEAGPTELESSDKHHPSRGAARTERTERTDAGEQPRPVSNLGSVDDSTRPVPAAVVTDAERAAALPIGTVGGSSSKGAPVSLSSSEFAELDDATRTKEVEPIVMPANNADVADDAAGFEGQRTVQLPSVPPLASAPPAPSTSPGTLVPAASSLDEIPTSPSQRISLLPSEPPSSEANATPAQSSALTPQASSSLSSPARTAQSQQQMVLTVYVVVAVVAIVGAIILAVVSLR